MKSYIFTNGIRNKDACLMLNIDCQEISAQMGLYVMHIDISYAMSQILNYMHQ